MRRSTTLARITSVVVPLVGATSIALAVTVMTPGRALACSCVQPQPMAGYAGEPNAIVFAGSIAPGTERVVVRVETWFKGGPDPLVELDASAFGTHEESCQVGRPAAGSRWIFVAFIPEPGADPQVNLCTPHALLDSPDGRAMLADARAVFGGRPPASATISPEPAAPVTNEPAVAATSPAAGAPSTDGVASVSVPALAIVIVLVGALVVGATWVRRALAVAAGVMPELRAGRCGPAGCAAGGLG